MGVQLEILDKFADVLVVHCRKSNVASFAASDLPAFAGVKMILTGGAFDEALSASDFESFCCRFVSFSLHIMFA